jgi:hypothetical protein
MNGWFHTCGGKRREGVNPPQILLISPWLNRGLELVGKHNTPE